jgi:arsenate reductase (thioredoxin)
MIRRKRVLFLCTNNSARSQMAEAILNNLFPGSYQAFSAGTEPTKVNPNVLKALAEKNIPAGKLYSKSVDTFSDQEFDYVVTLCDSAQKTCPFFPGAINYIHNPFEDPAKAAGNGDEPLDSFRKVRDEIEQWIVKTFGSDKKEGAQ